MPDQVCFQEFMPAKPQLFEAKHARITLTCSSVVYVCLATLAWYVPGCTGGYVRREVGNCDGHAFIETAAQCAAAAVVLGLDDTDAGAGRAEGPLGCYWHAERGGNNRLLFNLNGDRNDDDTDRVSICSKSAAMHVG